MNVFVTGANRGLGLEFATQYKAAGDRVFAACRRRSAALDALGVDVVAVDVADPAAVVAAAAAVAAAVDAIDVVVNNAAVNPKGMSLGSYDAKKMLESFAVNAVAPVVVLQAFLPLLRKSARPRVLNIGTQVGSFTWNAHGRSPLYAASKAALHMYTKTMAHELKDVVMAVAHPGWVQTDMGGAAAPLTPTQSVTQLRALIERLAPADHGSFFNVDGQPHPW